MKLCIRIRTGENLHLIRVSEVGVSKWLNSATYKCSTVCASSYVSRTCTKIGPHMYHTNTYKKVSWYKIQNPTGSKLF